MKSLPDPRIYALPGDDPLALLAQAAAQTGAASQQTAPGRALLEAVRATMAEGAEARLQGALAHAGSAAARRALQRAIDLAVEASAPEVGVRAFAFPLLLIAGGLPAGKIPGIVPDVSVLRELLEVHGALGRARNVGLGEALVSAESLARLDSAAVHARGGGGPGLERLHLPPADVVLESAEEQVHLRFIVGAAVTPREAPGVPETAANIGAWGMGWTRALAGQLGQPGLALLPVPRPPLPIRDALAAGRFAWREAGFQLFLSRTLRRFRSSVGEPDVSVCAAADGSVRVHLRSRFDDTLEAEFVWSLEPDDDLAAVTASIVGLLAECGVGQVAIADTVRPVPASH